MTRFEFFLIVAGLAIPAIYERVMFAFNRPMFYRIEFRNRTGLNIHHGHWGLLMVFIAMFMFFFNCRNCLSIGLGAFGSGLILDEIMPMLHMPSKGRHMELEVYGQSRGSTIILITGLIFILSVLFVIGTLIAYFASEVTL